MTDFALPDDAYFGWLYVDRRGGVDRAQVYFDDGRVEAIERDRRTELCQFNDEQVAAARDALRSAGLAEAADVTSEGHDTAVVVYAWRTEDGAGRLTNGGYPAVEIAEIQAFDAKLAEIEEAAGCWPLIADEDAAAEYAAMDD